MIDNFTGFNDNAGEMQLGVCVKCLLVLCIYLLAWSQPAINDTQRSLASSKALVFDTFKQLSPTLGADPTQRTTVSVRNDAEFLYVDVRAYGDRPYASVQGRDESLNNDDFIEVVIDSENSKSTARVFQTNALGTRRDMEISRNGNAKNDSWNTFWDVSTSILSDHWVASFKIPFSSLQFTPAESVIMGLMVHRYIKSGNEMLAMPLEQTEISDVEYNLQNTVDITLKNVRGGNPLYFTPYFAGNAGKFAELNDAETVYTESTDIMSGKNYVNADGLDKFLSNIGFDLKYKMGSNATLDLSLNTDFAQAEADDRIVNLTRFDVRLPEKRAFFLENTNLFDIQIGWENTLFNSRTIGIEDEETIPLVAGLRYVGNSGSHQYGVMSMQSGDLDTDTIPAINYTVGRYKYQFGQQDNHLGLMVSAKHRANGEYDRMFTIDNRSAITESLTLTASASKNIKSGVEGDDLGVFLRMWSFPSSGYVMNLMAEMSQPNFEPEMAFVGRTNYYQFAAFNGHAWLFDDTSMFNRYSIGLWSGFFWEYDTERPLTRDLTIWNNLQLKNGWSLEGGLLNYTEDYLYEVWEFSNDINIPIDRYEMVATMFNINNGNATDYKLAGSFRAGSFYGGSLISINPKIGYIFNSTINAEFNVNLNFIDLPDRYSTSGNAETTRTVAGMRINIAFNNAVSLKTYLQYDDESESIGSNIRFRYNPTEGTDLYIVYNQLYNTTLFDVDNIRRPRFQTNSIILKFSKTFIL